MMIAGASLVIAAPAISRAAASLTISALAMVIASASLVIAAPAISWGDSFPDHFCARHGDRRCFPSHGGACNGQGDGCDGHCGGRNVWGRWLPRPWRRLRRSGRRVGCPWRRLGRPAPVARTIERTVRTRTAKSCPVATAAAQPPSGAAQRVAPAQAVKASEAPVGRDPLCVGFDGDRRQERVGDEIAPAAPEPRSSFSQRWSARWLGESSR